MKELYFVTTNKGKLKEMRALLHYKIRSKSAEIDEIQAIEASDVAADKARKAYALVRKPVIVEDVGLYLNALDRFPGALIKFAELRLGYLGICRMLDPYKDRSASAEALIAFYDGKTLKQFSGKVYGRIAKRPRVRNGFGFDCIFIPNGYSKTFAEMDPAVKERISHRRKAVRKLSRYLDSLPRQGAELL